MVQTTLSGMLVSHKGDYALREQRLDKSGVSIRVSDADLYDLEG
jgi:hypothetical protein